MLNKKEAMTETAEYPKGFAFDHKTHIGTMNEDPWPSVTQLLQEFKLIDYSGVPEKVLENKRLLGTRVDRAIVLLNDCNRLDEDDFYKNFPECIPYLEAYRKFRLFEKFDLSDKKVGRLVSLKWRFHGQPDEHGVLVYYHGPEAYLIDWKCTFKMFPSTGAQLYGYKMLFLECLKIKIKKRFGLLLRPNGHYELIEFKDPNDEQDFKACLWLHWARRDKYKTARGVLDANGN